MCVAKVTFVRQPTVNFCFVERVFYFIREYAGREARYDLLRIMLIGGMENIVVDEDVIP